MSCRTRLLPVWSSRFDAKRLLATVLLSATCMSAPHPASATTYYVRVDGGDAVECTGRSDAPYPGSGTGQACAWKHPFQALAPDGTRRIAGGDTLLIGGGSYMIGQGAPGAGSCLPANCSMAAVPSGSVGAVTRILGDPGNPPRLWGTLGVTRILSLDGSSNVEIGYLDITDQDDCVYSHSNASVKCPAVGSGMWGKHGVYARASSNVWLHDLDIHGLGHTGLWAGGLTDWTLERVRLNRNGRAGWDANIGTGSSNSGAITLRNMEIAWNGCGERWQTGAAWACWGQQAGGYGDGLGTVTTAGQWLIEDVFVHHNTQDGLDLRFLDGANTTHATLRRIHAVANAGNQVKLKGNALVENSVLIGSCGYFSNQFFMLAADQCRADGTTLLLVFTPNDNVIVRHNSITGQGWTLIGATEGDSSGRALVQNNVLVGFPWFLNPADIARVQAGNSPAVITHTGNLVWNVYGNACPGDSLCGQHPMLKSMALASFDAEPLAGSPLADKVAPLADVTTDFLLNSRPNGTASDIGAYELQGAPACVRAAPSITLSGSTSAVAPGTTVTYALELTNNDSAGCTATSFSLAGSVPPDWSDSLAAASLLLAPGASGSTTLSVTSPTDAAAGGYTIAVGASSAVGTVHTAATDHPYVVEAPAPVCTHATPTLGVSGPSAAVAGGATVAYTVSLDNRDSSACANTTFSLAATAPPGWSGVLSADSLSLAPGASGSATLTVTSATDATAGDYGIGVGAGSDVGALHTASAAATYTVSDPAPACARLAPTVSLSGPGAAVAAGTSVAYTLHVENNDPAACATTTFNLARSIPAGWTGTLDANSLSLAPGTGGDTTLTVTSAPDAAAAGYSIGVGVGSNAGAVHTGSASVTYTVDAPTPVCTRAAPTVQLSGPGAAVAAGTAVDYAVSVANHDSSACAGTDFTLASSVPAGWSGELSASSLSVAPGQTGSITLTVTSAADAAAGAHAVGIGLGSTAGAVHTASDTATYLVAEPPPICTRGAPTVSVSGPTSPVQAGSAITYTVAITNTDDSACATTSFSLAATVATGWTGTLATSSLSLAPGASGSTTLTVTSAGNASAGGYAVDVATSSSAGAPHMASASTTFTVAEPPPVCTRGAPTFSLTGPTAAVAAGTAVDYTVSVRNNDSSACASTSFGLARTVPAGWSGTLTAAALGLAPGASGSTTLRVTSATTATAGNYVVGSSVSSSAGAIHAASASAGYTVAAPVINLQTTVTTDKATYARRGTVQITAALRNNGAAVSGASVTFTITRPGTTAIVLSATSASDGNARVSYKIPNAKGALGQYTVQASWSLGGVGSSAATTFTVL